VGQQRLTAIFRGTVQGVGFRWQASRALKGLDVTGYVRNLRDGTVELVVEGTAQSTSEAVARVRDVLGHLISGEHDELSEATGEFPSFGIRR